MGIEVNTLQIANELLLPEVVKLLHEGHTVTLPLRGYSMRPFLEDGRDKALLQKPSLISIGDAVLAEIRPGHFVLHRIVELEGENVTLRGDGNIGTLTLSNYQTTTKKSNLFVRPSSKLHFRIQSADSYDKIEVNGDVKYFNISQDFSVKTDDLNFCPGFFLEIFRNILTPILLLLVAAAFKTELSDLVVKLHFLLYPFVTDTKSLDFGIGQSSFVNIVTPSLR